MPTLNDILTANGDYTPVSGYPVDDKYENDSPVINVYDRTIGEIAGDTSTSGENVSQYLTFRIPRHPDHYDLIENGTNIRILYRLEDDTGEDVVPVNVVANEDYIIFGWKIPLVVTVNPGVVTFIIHAYKSENNIITYHYKTLPKTYMILETMETDVVVPEIEMYNLAEAYARGTITDVFGQTRPVEEGEPGYRDNSKYYKELADASSSNANKAKDTAVNAKIAAQAAQRAAEDARDQAEAIVGGQFVSYGQEQSLYENQKSMARRNIDAISVSYIDEIVINTLLGGVTKIQYDDLMKNWFIANSSEELNDLTDLVEKWYKITRIGWNGGTKFDKPSVSSVSTGTAIGDNIGMNCTPSTNNTANTDDYASNPMFAIKDANITLDSDGEPHVIAIEGIPSANTFDRYDTTKVVEVLQMTPWIKYSEDEVSYSWEYTDEIGKAGYIPWPSAVSLKDNHVRTFVHHVKYAFGDGYTACSGQKVRVWDVSHNGQLTGVHAAWGNRYGGKSCSDDAWVKHMTYIKYKSLTLDGIMNGCLSYYYNTTKPAVAEENVERVIIAKSTASAWIVGSTICIGSAAYANKSSQCSVVDRAKIVSIEDITIEGTVYSAVNLDNGGVKFTTTTELFVTTMQWYTGSTDNVKGNDGSPYSNTSTKEPYKVQGIEQIVGCYEVIGDTILSYIDGYQVPHVCRDATKLATSITADYKRCSFGFLQSASSEWKYSKRLGFDPNLPELLYPSESGGSSSTFTKDGYYIEATGITGLREWLAFGNLGRGLTHGGLSFLYGGIGLTYSYWDLGGRLSSNINRGEFEQSAS